MGVSKAKTIWSCKDALIYNAEISPFIAVLFISDSTSDRFFQFGAELVVLFTDEHVQLTEFSIDVS